MPRKKTFSVTPKRLQILEVLRDSDDGLGPTDIGLQCGIRYSIASSWCTDTVAALLAQKMISRKKGEGNIVLYRLLKKGASWLEKSR